MGIIFRTFPKSLWKFKSKTFQIWPIILLMFIHIFGEGGLLPWCQHLSVLSLLNLVQSEKTYLWGTNSIGTVKRLNLACMQNSSCWFYLGFLLFVILLYVKDTVWRGVFGILGFDLGSICEGEDNNEAVFWLIAVWVLQAARQQIKCLYEKLSSGIQVTEGDWQPTII